MIGRLLGRGGERVETEALGTCHPLSEKPLITPKISAFSE